MLATKLTYAQFRPNKPIKFVVPFAADGAKISWLAHWAGVHPPTGVLVEVMDKRAAAMDTAMKTPKIANRLKSVGIEPMGSTRATFVQFVAEERAAGRSRQNFRHERGLNRGQ